MPGEHNRGVARLDDLPHPGRGPAGVQREKGSAGLLHRDHSGQEMHVPLGEQHDHGLGADTFAREALGDARTFPRELLVTEPAVRGRNRRRLGRAFCLSGEALGERAATGMRGLGFVPIEKELPAFACREQGKARNPFLGIGDDGLEKITKVRCHPPDGRRLKEIGAVFEPAAQGSVGLGQLQRQVEPGDAGLRINKLHRQPWQCRGLRRRALQNEHDAKQGVSIEAARQLETLQNLLDGQVLVSISIQGHLPHATEDLTELRIA